MTIYKACDIRGIVGVEWDTPEAERIGRSLGHMLRRRGHKEMVVGGDYRRSTPRLKMALIEGLSQAGIVVHDVGQVATPLVEFAARQIDCPNLAVVTASHHPGKYNGVKFVLDGRAPVPEMIQQLATGAQNSEPSGQAAPSDMIDIVEQYQQWVVAASRDFVLQQLAENRVPAEQSSSGETPATEATESDTDRAGEGKPLRIVIDTMGGAFTGLAPRAVMAAGFDVVSIDDKLDPDFTDRAPDPAVDENLVPVINALAQTQSDIGFALDGDGDRVIFVDRQGRIARPEQITAILVRHLLGKCRVIYDLKSASLLARTVEQSGGTAVAQPSGDGFIKQELRRRQAEIGVEVNGRHCFGCLEGGGDGLFAALVLLNLLRRTGQRLDQWVAGIGWPAITSDLRIPYEGDALATLDEIAENCGGSVSRLDGIRADYEGGWALARASITEPAITFRFEGEDEQQMRTIVRRFLTSVPELYQRVQEQLP